MRAGSTMRNAAVIRTKTPNRGQSLCWGRDCFRGLGFEDGAGAQGVEDADVGGEVAEGGDAADAVGVEGVVDVLGEVVADGGGWERDARGPLADEVFGVGEAVLAGGVEVGDELGARLGGGDSFRTHGPDGGDPGQSGALIPLGGDVVPGAWAGFRFDVGAAFEGEQGGVADEQRGVGLGEHGDGIGGGRLEVRRGAEEVAEEHLCVGDRAARGGVGGDGADVFEAQRSFDDELDGADLAQGRDGAAGDDAQLGGEGGDGDEAEVGTAGEELGGALRGRGEVEAVALGQLGVEGRVVEVPHERGGVEEVDGGYAERHRFSLRGPDLGHVVGLADIA